MNWLLSRFFAFTACKHPRETFPQTKRGSGYMYTACLSCGKEWAYDWKNMRRGTEIPERPLALREVESANG
jgi:hypothetical protein